MAAFLLASLLSFSQMMKCLSISELSKNCHKVELFGPGGAIFSPGYPNFYHNHTSCTWYLSANPGDLVTIKFKDLDIEEDEGFCLLPPCCSDSWVKIEAYRVFEMKYCGSVVPDPLFLDSRKISIKFHTSVRARGGRGFRLTYSVGKCIEGKLKCKTTNLCYDPLRRCDGTFDCPDFSDELDCGGCPLNMTSCGTDSECFSPFTQHCDGVTDCPSGKDEKGCSKGCLESIRCSSGVGCYSQNERCDGVTNCGDASDEKNCKPELCRSSRGGFLCANGHCIREAWKCDRTNDCGDGSDEANCVKNSVITATIMGSLICGLLLVVAISCSLKLYSLRNAEQQLSCRETPLFNMEQDFVYREPPPPYSFVVGDFARSWLTPERRQPQVHVVPRGLRNGRRPRRPHGRPRTHPVPGTSSSANPVSLEPTQPSTPAADSGGQGCAGGGREMEVVCIKPPIRKLSSESNKSEDKQSSTECPTQGELTFRNGSQQQSVLQSSDYLCDNLVVLSDTSSDDALLIPLEDASSS